MRSRRSIVPSIRHRSGMLAGLAKTAVVLSEEYLRPTLIGRSRKNAHSSEPRERLELCSSLPLWARNKIECKTNDPFTASALSKCAVNSCANGVLRSMQSQRSDVEQLVVG